jgi:hypothetical protein
VNKIFILAISSIIIGCSPKSTPESEALLNEIYATQSKTKVGINYMDYSKVAQELQVNLDNFERSEKSRKIKYAGNLVATAESYISAADKEYEEDWYPHFHWKKAAWSYEYMQNCQTENKNCYGYDDKFQPTTDLITRATDELTRATDELTNSDD